MKDIPGYEGLYKIDEYGNVYSSHTRNKHSMKDEIIRDCICKGYHQIKLSKNGTRKTFSKHRLVAMAYIDNPDNKPDVNHIDGNKSNNHRSNLEWVTHKENIKHARETNLYKPKESLQWWNWTTEQLAEYERSEVADKATFII